MGHMGAAMGHACAHTWAIYGGIHGPHGSSNGACMGAYMGHIWGHTWGMHARIHGHIWEQPYRESREEGNNRELPWAYPFPSLPLPPGKGREGKVIPALFRSVLGRILINIKGINLFVRLNIFKFLRNKNR